MSQAEPAYTSNVLPFPRATRPRPEPDWSFLPERTPELVLLMAICWRMPADQLAEITSDVFRLSTTDDDANGHAAQVFNLLKVIKRKRTNGRG